MEPKPRAQIDLRVSVMDRMQPPHHRNPMKHVVQAVTHQIQEKKPQPESNQRWQPPLVEQTPPLRIDRSCQRYRGHRKECRCYRVSNYRKYRVYRPTPTTG